VPDQSEFDALVVGSGPNGLAAAVTLAEAGLSVRVYEAATSVGGGCRTEELTRPGFLHDVCSAIHPLGVGSPFLSSRPLTEHGLEWVHPEIPVAHPLDGGRAAWLERSLDRSAEALGADGERYARTVRPFVEAWDGLVREIMAPAIHLPRRPLMLARFGLLGLQPATWLARRFETETMRGLWAGLAAHAIAPPTRPITGALALVFAATAHAVGWPAARGGSQAVTDALVSYLTSLGGEVVTGQRVGSLDELPTARVVLLDVMPGALADIAGDHLPVRYRQKLRRYRHGPGVFKVDYALSEPVPWTAEVCRRAGTVHVGGSLTEVGDAEEAVRSGKPADRPLVIVAQQSLFDATRAPAGSHTLWAYAHVPHGFDGDATSAIEDQIERFAPGFRDTVMERHTRGPAALEAGNPNLVGGDIAGGAVTGLQAIFRPMVRVTPYATPNPRIYLCSSATPPGAGVHGMCGYLAARVALRRMS
jgi:phytoene dehydrogenase-like protein